MKQLPKIFFVLYILTLLWLVLFKFSFDIFSVVLDYQSRNLNLVPFLGVSQSNVREMIDNFVVFIPFGLLLCVNFKKVSLWRKLAFVFIFSLGVEILQFIFAIGTTDVTDVITNTLGGFVGLVLYDLAKKYIDNKKLDQFITIAGAILLIVLILFRTLFLRVRY